MQLIWRIADFLTIGAVINALNMPSVSAEEALSEPVLEKVRAIDGVFQATALRF